MSEMITFPVVDQGEFKHSRSDRWWGLPVAQSVGLILFIIYSFWVVMIDQQYSKIAGTHYVSPFYSPEIDSIESQLPESPFLSPALILIWIPLGFRFTCYYARKVYHRAFLADPPACAVSELRKVNHKYKGENKLPFIVSNLHRYFFYLAFVLAVVHIIDFFRAMQFEAEGVTRFGVGTFLLGLDALFLTLYVLSCHSCKHLVGGGLNCYTCSSTAGARYKTWSFVTKINEKHGWYFWLSMITLAIADLYIRLLARGTIDWAFDKWQWF